MAYEPIQTQATLRHIEAVEWDAMGQRLIIQSLAGSEDDLNSYYLGLTPASAQQLMFALAAKFEETSNGPRLKAPNDVSDKINN